MNTVPAEPLPIVKTILLADDDIDDQDFISEAFLNIDNSIALHAVLHGGNVLPLLEALPDASLPQLIVLDYNLPDMNGAEVLHLLNQNSRYDTIPRIVWSTSNSPQYRNHCLELGAAFYLVKPCDIQSIETMARHMLGHCNATG